MKYILRKLDTISIFRAVDITKNKLGSSNIEDCIFDEIPNIEDIEDYEIIRSDDFKFADALSKTFSYHSTALINYSRTKDGSGSKHEKYYLKHGEVSKRALIKLSKILKDL